MGEYVVSVLYLPRYSTFITLMRKMLIVVRIVLVVGSAEGQGHLNIKHTCVCVYIFLSRIFYRWSGIRRNKDICMKGSEPSLWKPIK